MDFLEYIAFYSRPQTPAALLRAMQEPLLWLGPRGGRKGPCGRRKPRPAKLTGRVHHRRGSHPTGNGAAATAHTGPPWPPSAATQRPSRTPQNQSARKSTQRANGARDDGGPRPTGTANATQATQPERDCAHTPSVKATGTTRVVREGVQKGPLWLVPRGQLNSGSVLRRVAEELRPSSLSAAPRAEVRLGA